MKLEASKKKLPESKKEQLKSFLMGAKPSIHKTIINTESYKVDPAETAIEEKTDPLLEGIKRDTTKMFSYLTNIKNVLKTNNTSNETIKNKNLFSFSYPKNISSDTSVSSLKTSNSVMNKNIDQNVVFKPSTSTLQQIHEKFNTSMNPTNILNITKRPMIPAMRQGGVVKEPMVSYLHENEAVVPLKESKQFSDVIKIISKETKNNITKNEKTNNTSELRNYTANRSMTQNNRSDSSNKQNNTSVIDNRSSPIIVQGGGGGEKDTLTAKIPTVYSGSASTSEFFVNSSRVPSWRTSIG